MGQGHGRGDARVCEYVQAWSRGLRRRVGIEVRAFGMESIDWSRTYVIMANHAELPGRAGALLGAAPGSSASSRRRSST